MKRSMQIFILLLAIIINIPVYGQDVMIDGKTYTVNSKTQINPGFEYGTFKQKNTKGNTESFINVNGLLSKTIFTEKEIKAFLTNGTISSLGKIIEKEVIFKGKKSTLNYIEKNNVKVFFLIKAGELRIREFAGNIILAKKNDGAPEPGSELDQCYTGCEKILIADVKDGWSELQASIWYFDCQVRCETAFPIDNPTRNIEYGIPLKGMAIQVR